MDLFFRVVSLSYKGKEYRYLRLMKSIRQGKKVRQLEIMNLANISQTPGETVKAMLDELKDLLSLCNSLCRHTGDIAKISFLIALETAFQPKAACPASLLRTIYSNGTRDGGGAVQVSELLFSHIRELHLDKCHNGIFILWLTPLTPPDSPENLWAGYLMTESGLPVKYSILNQHELCAQRLIELSAELEQKYQSRNLLLLIPASPLPDTGVHENEEEKCAAPGRGDCLRPGFCPAPEKFYSVLADVSLLRGGELENMLAEAASSINFYDKFVKRLAGVTGDEIKHNQLLEMFMMFHLFTVLIDNKKTLPKRSKSLSN